MFSARKINKRTLQNIGSGINYKLKETGGNEKSIIPKKLKLNEVHQALPFYCYRHFSVKLIGTSLTIKQFV